MTVTLASEYRFQGSRPIIPRTGTVKKPTGPTATTYPKAITTGERKIGTSSAGSSQRRPGRSVRTTRNARSAPSGTAMAVIPAATMRVLPNARWKSVSMNTN